MGTAGAGRAPDMLDTVKGCSDSDMYNAGTAEEGLRKQTEVDGPKENRLVSKRGEAVLVTAARAGG